MPKGRSRGRPAEKLPVYPKPRPGVVQRNIERVQAGLKRRLRDRRAEMIAAAPFAPPGELMVSRSEIKATVRASGDVAEELQILEGLRRRNRQYVPAGDKATRDMVDHYAGRLQKIVAGWYRKPSNGN